MTSMLRIIGIFWLFSSLIACNSANRQANADDPVLASVYDKKLYRSQVLPSLPEGIHGPDSVALLYQHANRWVQDQLMMYEAERNIPKEVDVDELVRDYRASLLRFNYEEQIIARQLDSTVAESELQAFYKQNEEQFQLESTILKCLLLKVPSKAPQSEINKIWYSRSDESFEELKKYANRWASRSLLEPKKWHKLEDIAAILPKGTLTPENAASRREGTVNDGDSRYYYRVLEVVKGKSTAPFDYIRDRAKTLVLHRRKQEVLEKWKNDLYSREMGRQNAEILIKLGQ